MFTSKANSKDKCEKKTREHESGLERSKYRLSEVLPVAVRLQLASISLKRTFNSSAEFFTGLNHFSPQNPNFDLPTSKFVPKGCLQVYIHQKALKVTQNLKLKHHFNIIQQFTKLS